MDKLKQQVNSVKCCSETDFVRLWKSNPLPTSCAQICLQQKWILNICLTRYLVLLPGLNLWTCVHILRNHIDLHLSLQICKIHDGNIHAMCFGKARWKHISATSLDSNAKLCFDKTGGNTRISSMQLCFVKVCWEYVCHVCFAGHVFCLRTAPLHLCPNMGAAEKKEACVTCCLMNISDSTQSISNSIRICSVNQIRSRYKMVNPPTHKHLLWT